MLEIAEHEATTNSSGRQFEQGLHLSEDKESEYSPETQGLHATDTLYDTGTELPQGIVTPKPGGHIGQSTQRRSLLGDFITN